MGIKFDQKNKHWVVSFSKRHPITRKPVSLRRMTITKNKGVKVKIKSKADADRVYRQLVLEVEDKLRKTQIPTWETCINEYLIDALNRGHTNKTLDSYKMCLRAHTLEPWGDRLVDTITGNEIRSLIINKLGHRSESHRKSMRKFINAVFSYAYECSYITINPTPKMKFKIGNKIKSVLTQPQIKTLLERAKERDIEWYPHWTMAVYTGMRSGELYALTWDKVNFDKRVILVDSAWSSKDGFKDTKSGHDRIVEIAPSLLYLLKELKLKNTDCPFVLPRIDKWDKGEQAKELRMFLLGLGLPEVRFHDLRASWATVMLSQGVEPIKVMSMGGWRDLKTMQRYIRKAGVDIKGITNNLDLHNPNRIIAKLIPFNG